MEDVELHGALESTDGDTVCGVSPEPGTGSQNLSCKTRSGREGVQLWREWLPDGAGKWREDAAVR